MGKKQNSRSGLVIIGNEILSGRTNDANIQYIGTQMAEHGVPLSEVAIVPDVEDKIVAAVNILRAEYDHVFTTGGIGPTHDDITSACIAKAFGVEHTRHEQAHAVLEAYYGKEELTPARAKMAVMPVGAKLIPNPVSGAPGFYIDNVYVMAGIPNIMQAMLDHVVKVIERGLPILSKNVRSNMPESVIAQELGEVQRQHPHVDIGSYPGFKDGKFWTNIVLRSTDERAMNEAAAIVEMLIRTKS